MYVETVSEHCSDVGVGLDCDVLLIWLEDKVVKMPIALEVDVTELEEVDTLLVVEHAVALEVMVVT